VVHPRATWHIEDIDKFHEETCHSNIDEGDVLARFYTVINGVRIYADPCALKVAESWGGGFLEFELYIENLRYKGIAEAMIKKLEVYFAENVGYRDEDDEYAGNYGRYMR